MNNGKISSTNNDGIAQYSGDITITGGEVSGNYGISPYGSTNNCGTVTLGINDGGVPSTTSPRIYGESYAMTPANKFTQLNFYDGKVEFSKEMAEYGTPINPKPGDSSYTNPIKTPSGYSILLSSDKTTYTLGKLTPITDTTKIKPGIVINYPTLSNSVSITNSEYKTGIIEAQTFSTNGSKIKCVVIRNTNNVVEIVPLEGQYLALYSYVAASNDDKKFDTIANIYHNPTYSENSYHIGSPKRTTYTTEQDANAIYNVYKDNKTDFSSIYPKSYRYNYYSSRYAEEVNLNSSDWALESYQYFWTREYYEYPAWGVYAYYVGNSDGKYESYWLSDDEGSGAYDNGLKARIMPIISLKTTIGITGGNGTINSPYELGA